MWNHLWLSIPLIHHTRGFYTIKKQIKISNNIKKRYKSGVGSILYLVKHPRNEWFNAADKLLKCMEKANMDHYKSLLFRIKYVIDKTDYFYHIKTEGNLNGTQELCGYGGADWSGDKRQLEKRDRIHRSNGKVVTAWRLKNKKTVTLSVTEVEYSEITGVCYKIIFFHVILLFMGVVVEYPITVNIDNIGAILLSENVSVSQHTNHIYVHCHFIWDYNDNRAAKIKSFF